MLRAFFITLLFISLMSCSEETTNSSSGDPEISESQVNNSKSTTLKEFTDHFNSVSEIPTLDLQDMDVSLVLDKESFQSIEEYSFLTEELVHDWITPFIGSNSDNVNENNWTAIFYKETETNSTYCLAQIEEEHIKVYLLRLNKEKESNSELILLGSIGTFKYKDSNEEAGEKYDFEITDCEDLIIEIKGDQLLTKCMRYSATVGKDWRVDQNLYVNDTVKLPIIENSYSLY